MLDKQDIYTMINIEIKKKKPDIGSWQIMETPARRLASGAMCVIRRRRRLWSIDKRIYMMIGKHP